MGKNQAQKSFAEFVRLFSQRYRCGRRAAHLQRITDRRHRIDKRSKPGADGFDVDLRDTCKCGFNTLSQFFPCCYLTQCVRRGHFCRALTVACKIRLCLHPGSGASRPVVTPSHEGLGPAFSSVLDFYIIKGRQIPVKGKQFSISDKELDE